jgi:hypothetical protein
VYHSFVNSIFELSLRNLSAFDLLAIVLVNAAIVEVDATSVSIDTVNLSKASVGAVKLEKKYFNEYNEDIEKI